MGIATNYPLSWAKGPIDVQKEYKRLLDELKPFNEWAYNEYRFLWSLYEDFDSDEVINMMTEFENL